MKIRSVVACAMSAVLLSTTVSFSQSSGIFGTGVVISSDIAGSSTFNLYEITLLGDSRHTPAVPGGGVTLGVAPTLVNTAGGGGNTTWATGSGPSLGTFTQGVDTLTLNGSDMLTYKNGGANVSATYIAYSIDGGSFAQYSLAFNQNDVNTTTGDQRWYSDGMNINLLNGLGVGTHTLTVYFFDDNTVTTHDYISNFGNNFSANFTIVTVPEPSTLAICGLSGLATFFMIRRRR